MQPSTSFQTLVVPRIGTARAALMLSLTLVAANSQAHGAFAYYVHSTSGEIRRFDPYANAPPETVFDVNVGSLSGIAIDDTNTAWVCSFTGTLVSYNLTTGATAFRSWLAEPEGLIKDLAWDPVHRRVLGVTALDEIIEIDRTTISATVLGTFTGTGGAHLGGLAVSSSGALTIVTDSPGALFDLVPNQGSTGWTAVPRGTVVWRSPGLSYDPETGLMFASQYDDPEGKIWRVNADGTRTLQRSGIEWATGLAFMPVPAPTSLAFLAAGGLAAAARHRRRHPG